MSDPHVKEHIENGISTIEFFHPAHNSLPGDILAKLALTIKEAGAVMARPFPTIWKP